MSRVVVHSIKYPYELEMLDPILQYMALKSNKWAAFTRRQGALINACHKTYLLAKIRIMNYTR